MNDMRLLQGFISKQRYETCNNLFLDLKKADYAVVKGEPLSFLAYKKFGERCGSDIDILLPKETLDFVECLLEMNMFAKNKISRTDRILMLSSSHQVQPWSKEIAMIGGVTIDLNFDLFWGEYTGRRIDINKFLFDTIEMEIYGVKVKTLPPIKAMIQLVLHHYKDMNSLFLLATRKSIRYDMFKDVYYLLKNNLDVVPLDKLYAMSAEYEIIPYVFYVLYYTGQIFDDDVLKQYIEAFRTPEGDALLNCYGLCEKERREWKCDFKTRLDSDHLYELIKDDLTERDKEKIAINKRIFLGISE
mgnify:CR=1 FL=1